MELNLRKSKTELVKRREEEIWEDDSQIEYAETLRRMMGDYEVPEV